MLTFKTEQLAAAAEEASAAMFVKRQSPDPSSSLQQAASSICGNAEAAIFQAAVQYVCTQQGQQQLVDSAWSQQDAACNYCNCLSCKTPAVAVKAARTG
jgi:hypothetical protein